MKTMMELQLLSLVVCVSGLVGCHTTTNSENPDVHPVTNTVRVVTMKANEKKNKIGIPMGIQLFFAFLK